MQTFSIFSKNAKQNRVQHLLCTCLTLTILFFSACVNESDLDATPKTVDQYALELKTDPSYLALQEGMRKMTNEASLSGVEIFELTTDDLRSLRSASGENKKHLIQTFTNRPKFLMNAEVVIAPLITSFLNAHTDLAKEEQEVIQKVFMKLKTDEIEDFLKKEGTSLKPDCAGQCNQAYGTSMMICAANYSFNLALLIMGTASSGGYSIPIAAAGYIVNELQRSMCEGGAVDALSLCHTACGME